MLNVKGRYTVGGKGSISPVSKHHATKAYSGNESKDPSIHPSIIQRPLSWGKIPR
jgi:hypothetical protein